MNNDFRISTTFSANLKVQRLDRRLGDAGICALIRLWEHVAGNRSTGDISGMGAEGIEIVAKWRGEYGLFYKTLVELRFVDVDENGEAVAIHDWVEHNPWAFGAVDRKIKARKGRLCRHGYAVLPEGEHASFKSFVFGKLEMTLATTYEYALEMFEKFKNLTNLTSSTTPTPNPIPKPKPNPVPRPAHKPTEQAEPATPAGAFGLSASDFNSLTDYLREKGVFDIRKLQGLSDEIAIAAKDFGLTALECVECMKQGDWKGFRAEWVGTSKFWKEKQKSKAMDEASRNARYQIEKTRREMEKIFGPAKPCQYRQVGA